MGMRLWTNQIFRWYSRFRGGRELVEDDERCGRPKPTWTEVNIAAVADLVKNCRRIASRIIAESLNIPKAILLRILEEYLGKRKLCARFFYTPWHLSKGKIESHLAKTLSRWPMQTIFFNKMITGDETWCLACDSETKQQGSEWVGEISPRRKKMIIIFDSQGVLHRECIPEWKTVNAEF
jgi:hypothetical protein